MLDEGVMFKEDFDAVMFRFAIRSLQPHPAAMDVNKRTKRVRLIGIKTNCEYPNGPKANFWSRL